MEQQTVWLRQDQISLLFGRDRSVITKHLRNLFNEGELEEKSNVQIMHIAGSDRPVAFHTLDAVISVGYRVNSKRGTQFRIWATSVLRDHLLKGYSVNERRLRELAAEPLIQAGVDMKQDRITELFDKYNLLTLPVVDDENKLSGVITADDVISVLRQK